MTAPTDTAKTERRATLRRVTLQLVVGVCALDGLALAVYFLAGIAHAGSHTRMTFSVVWTVATALVVEVSTVKSHLARMLPKLGVRSRLQAVVWAYQNRIVNVPGATGD